MKGWFDGILVGSKFGTEEGCVEGRRYGCFEGFDIG